MFLKAKMLVLAALMASATALSAPAIAAGMAEDDAALDAAAGDVVASALSLIGTPYIYGGDDPEDGLDCSGLVGYVYNMAGYSVTLPRTSQQIFDLRLPTVDKVELDAGDLVFFRIKSKRINHVGIYIGGGQFVHAPNRKSHVRVEKLDTTYWNRYYAGSRRVLTALPEVTTRTAFN